MNCQDLERLLPEYLAEALPDSDAREAKTHLASCERCRALIGDLDRIESAAGRLPPQEPSTPCLLKISEAIHQFARPARRTEFGPVMDMDELADYLRVDRLTLEVHLDEIPCFELAGKILFNRRSIEDWIRRKETDFALQNRPPHRESGVLTEPEKTGGVIWKL